MSLLRFYRGVFMESQNRKVILTIVFFKKFITVFFLLFFNIYVLKNGMDVGIIIKYNLIGILFDGIFSIVVSSKITEKNAKGIYNASFVLLIICILLLITLKENICNYLYFFRILYSLTYACYYVPYEIVIMGSNSHKTMSNYLANINILNHFATILTPVFSGFIIEKFSYNMLFVILSMEGVLSIFLSSKIKRFYVDSKKVNLKSYLLKIKEYPHLSDIYKCMFYRRISLQGVITDLLPVLLFLKVGSELSVGSYNSLFAILSICSLSILKFINQKNIPKNFFVLFASAIFLASVLLIFNTSFITLLIYYIFINSFGAILESESCSAVYEAINMKELSKYKREHQITYHIYMMLGQILSYGFALILYTCFYNVNILLIAISIMMFFAIFEALYLQRTEQFLKSNQ